MSFKFVTKLAKQRSTNLFVTKRIQEEQLKWEKSEMGSLGTLRKE